ncbi:hypothetical protein H5V45_07090 [Nocardioides sp. KIGAM211]|uniref:Uncharacterized protein n=1 Tax=Nocardioides luti TaxID=2761101 RepID=A0A7X0RF10_9ACTN|nr:hypothetical protein [Nocardioides luti]MBB6627084.1 hypothetical protein [Nocardioides luti]
MRPLLAPVLALAALLLGACGDVDASTGPAAAPTPLVRPTAVPPAEGEVTTAYAVTVLDDATGRGPELCLGGVLDSLPPQCGGPSLVGWDWSEHEGDYQSAAGVRWGEFEVTGRFDGRRFTATRVVPADDVPPPASEDDVDEFATPCSAPAGGWTVDPGRVTQRDRNRAFAVARHLDDYVSSWVDTSLDPRTPEEIDQGSAGGAADVSRQIIDVRVLRDVAGGEAAVRRVWGGGLCVVRGGTRTDADLAVVQEQAQELPGALSSGRGVTGVVDVDVLHDDGTLQAWADQEYGPGVVTLHSALRPAR